MKKSFICSLCHNGILGGVLYLDENIDRDRYGAPLRGRYWHFHPTDNYHAGIHAWYGEPYAKVYY